MHIQSITFSTITNGEQTLSLKDQFFHITDKNGNDRILGSWKETIEDLVDAFCQGDPDYKNASMKMQAIFRSHLTGTIRNILLLMEIPA